MTSGLQPTGAGAPQPVVGVTGGPGINQGTASVDPGSGALILHPQPANVVQVRGSTPGAFQVYEYFHTNTDFARLALNAAISGPFQLAVETAPSTVIRDLDINTSGNLVINAPSTNISQMLNVAGNADFSAVASFGTSPNSVIRALIIGLGATTTTFPLVVRNQAQTLTLILTRDDGLVSLGGASQVQIGTTAGALGFFASGGTVKGTVTGAAAGNTALDSLLTILSGYGLITNGATP